MLRAWLLLMPLAACDAVFGVDPEAADGHDEDGDGRPDVEDACPHIPDEQEDTDGDGIGDACDRSDKPGTAYFFSFVDGASGLAIGGSMQQSADAIIVGSDSVGTDTVYLADAGGLPRDVHDAQVSVGFTILDRMHQFAEVGVVFGSRSAMETERGQICFAGEDDDSDPVFLQFNEHGRQLRNSERNDGQVVGVRADLHGSRIDGVLNCVFQVPPLTLRGESSGLSSAMGYAGVFAVNARVELRYLWIATLP